jgi:AraC-like DNA-binding protein
MAAPQLLRRIDFGTSDQAEARDALDRAYGGRLLVTARRESSWRVSFSQADTGSFTATEATLPADLTFKVDGQDSFVFNSLLGGVIARDHHKTAHHYVQGDVYLATHPGADFVSRARDVRLHAVSLRGSLLSEVAAQSSDEALRPVEFASARPSADGARRWRETTRFVDGLLADPAAASAPLLIASAGRLLASTALTAFPNSMVTEPSSADRRDAHPGTVQRAISFIEANADADIAVGEIAAAAHVTVRAVQLAFRRHLDTTPMAYLRNVRLDQAHRELDQADRGGGLTVTEVAFRWGFASPSRFTKRYKAAYGELPSVTLLR